jgi:hypothetical protein
LLTTFVEFDYQRGNMAKQIAVDWLTASQEGDVCPICIDNFNTPVFLEWYFSNHDYHHHFSKKKKG